MVSGRHELDNIISVVLIVLTLKFEVQQNGHSVVADVCQRAIVHNVVIW